MGVYESAHVSVCACVVNVEVGILYNTLFSREEIFVKSEF